MKFYISGALQGSNDLASARRIYEMAGKAVRSAGAVAYVPHLKTDPELNDLLDSYSVFTADLDEIKCSDGLIVFLNEPSLGVGAEIAIALSLGKSMLPLVERGKPFSRFVEGLINANGVFVVEYASLADLNQAIETHVSERLKTKNIDHLRSAIGN
jgi:hypothetical protein